MSPCPRNARAVSRRECVERHHDHVLRALTRSEPTPPVVTIDRNTRAPASTTASAHRTLRSTRASSATRDRAPSTERRTAAAGAIRAPRPDQDLRAAAAQHPQLRIAIERGTAEIVPRARAADPREVRALRQQRHVEVAHAVGGPAGRRSSRRGSSTWTLANIETVPAGRARAAGDREDPAPPVGHDRGVGARVGQAPQRERREGARGAMSGHELPQVEARRRCRRSRAGRARGRRTPAPPAGRRPSPGSRARGRSGCAAPRRRPVPSASITVSGRWCRLTTTSRTPARASRSSVNCEQRPVEHGQHRLRPQQRERAHPQAEARGEHHGLHRYAAA